MSRSSQEHHGAADRLTILSIVIFLLAAIIVLKLFYLQVVDYKKYSTLSANQHLVKKELDPNRGQIFIHDYQVSEGASYPVAINKKYYLVFSVPSEVKNPRATARALAPILAITEDDLYARLNKSGDVYEPLKHKLEEDQKKAIEDLKLPGIQLTEEIFRYYPEGDNLAQVVGFVGYKNDQLVGEYGAEGYWQAELAGQKGSYEFERDASGNLIPLAERTKAAEENGADLVLTLDRSVQFTACTALKKMVDKYGAPGGSVVIMVPQTGAILAMCNYPSFDPNNYGAAGDANVYNNSSIFEAYEPGSMIKGITMAAALDVGAVTPLTTYDDTGSEKIAGYTIKNSDGKAHGLKTMTQVLEESLNTGAIFAARAIGPELFRNYFERFGFGQKTGLPLNTEVAGNIGNLKKDKEIDMATASFGQGITATPLQIISAFSAIANGGKLMKPYIVDEVRSAGGKTVKTQPQFLRQVILPKTATTLSAMLASVVQYGHSKQADVPGYYIAGKTGTAQVANPGGKGYSADLSIHSFIGFAPIDNPRFVMLTKINNPKGVSWAESTAAPLFGEIAQFMLNYFKVPPDYQVNH